MHVSRPAKVKVITCYIRSVNVEKSPTEYKELTCAIEEASSIGKIVHLCVVDDKIVIIQRVRKASLKKQRNKRSRIVEATN